MGTTNRSKNSGLIAASIIFGFAVIICAIIVRATVIKVKNYGNTLSVTGAAFKPIISDFAIWESQVSVSNTELETAYANLKNDMAIVKSFLKREGFNDGDYELRNVNIKKQYNRERQVSGITLTQRIRLELDDVERIRKLAEKSSGLIERGVEFSSHPPRYLFTGLDALKLEMIKAATVNSKLRAEQLARTTGNEVGPPISASVGVFQIRPLHSQEVSGYGISDVSSIDKEIVCTVHIKYLIE
jgi:hypothetical protein